MIAAQLCRQGVEVFSELKQRASASSHDSFFHSGTGGIQGIFNSQFAVFQFGFCCSTHLDDGNTTGQFGNPLVQLFAVVIRLCRVELSLDCGNTIAHRFTVIVIRNDGGALFADRHPTGVTEILERHLVESHRLVFAD